MSGCELEVTVTKAEKLPITPLRIASSKINCNSYVEVTCGPDKFTTGVIRHNTSPTYDKVHKFTLEGPITDSTEPVVVKVFHKGRVGSNLIGRCDIPLGALRGTRLDNKFYQLKGQSGKAGRISIQLKYTDPNPPSASSAAALASNAGGSSSSNEPVDAEQTQAEMAQNKANENLVKIEQNFSTKTSDFQIRVKIIQGQALQSSNSIDPVTKVTVNGFRQQTRKKRSTFNPWFNETFYFNIHESPAKLFDEKIEFEVFNSRSLRKDAFIGGFPLDIGLVHQQDGHTFTRKWLMLSNPKDPAAGVKGYLKISVSVLGQGEEAPVDEEDTYDKNEDVEANLLRPVGVESEPIDLMIKCFKGQDMPRADVSMRTGFKALDKLTKQANKEYCDPYVKVSFSGVNRKTKVESNTYFPEWMQELHLPALLPSMCDNLMLQIMDSDLGFFLDSDDVLGTTKLSLGQISHSTGSGIGFLPCFGPAFINFYGAPREFELMPSHHSEDLNEGIGEGVAYRGRIMLELVSQPGGANDDAPRIDLPEYEALRIESYGHSAQTAYTLRVELLDLNMISDKVASGPIEVEISMGQFGNIKEKEVAVGTSVTTKLKPASDGSRYWFIAWEDKHPLLELYSEFEDVSFRMESHNILRRYTEKFRYFVNKLRDFKELPTPTIMQQNDMYFLCMHGLEEYISDCSTLLPALPAELFTKLDYNLREMRREKRKDAENAAKLLKSKPTVWDKRSGEVTDPGGLEQRGIAGLDDEFLSEMESLLRRQDELVYDPQISIPDCIIWILTKGIRRAYYRVPVVDIMYHKDVEAQGHHFGRVQSTFMKLPTKYKGTEAIAADVPCQLQFRAWFGPKKTEHLWPAMNGENIYLAETYENSRFLPIKGWSTPSLPNDPPSWSDNFGKVKQERNKAKLAPGLQWVNDWEAAPEEITVDPEASLDTVIEEIWQNQRYYPVKGWGSPGSHGEYTDNDMQVKYGVDKSLGSPECLRDTIELRPGWKWVDIDWKIDHSRPADAYGWDYATKWNSKTWLPGKKRVHFVRRRKWTRTRVRDGAYNDDALSLAKYTDTDDADDEGWEYNARFSSSKPYHRCKRKHDYVRRRRWQRVASATRWENEVEGTDGEFQVVVEQDDAPPQITPEQATEMYSIGRFLMFNEPREVRQFQLRCHLYQARDMIAEDEDGLSDPYARVIFGHRSSKSIIVKKNLCPTWDQVVIIDCIELCGNHLQRIDNYLMKVEKLKDDAEEAISKLDFESDDEEDEEDGQHQHPDATELPLDSETGISPEDEQAGYVKLASKKAQMKAKLDEHDKAIAKMEQEFRIREDLQAQLTALDDDLKRSFPRIIMEFFDHDARGRHDYLGRVRVSPHMMHIRTERNPAPATLKWLDIVRYEEDAGKVLCAFELLPCGEAPKFKLPPARKRTEEVTGTTVMVTKLPEDVRPETALTRIDVLASKFAKLSVGCPSVQFECGGVCVETEKLKGVKDYPNFGANSDDYCKLSFELFLPTQLYYAPPLNIRVFDNRKFGRKPLVGVHSISNVMEFLIDRRLRNNSELAKLAFGRRTFTMVGGTRPPHVKIDMDGRAEEEKKAKKKKSKKLLLKNKAATVGGVDPEYKDDTVDWWSKYFSSPGATGAQGRTKKGKYSGNLIHIYTKELEKEETVAYNPCEVVTPFPLTRGKGDKLKNVGFFKGDFAVFDAEGMDTNTKWDNLPAKANVECLVRVYIIKGLNLMPKDTNGRSDPYIKIQLGKKTVANDRKNYIPVNLNPIFGKCFEFEATVPLDNECTISVYDYDALSHDDLVGETVVDLEARLLSSARPLCGLPQVYATTGPDAWRDLVRPRIMLANYCAVHGFKPPIYSESDHSLPSDERPPPTVTVKLHGHVETTYTAGFKDSALDMSRPAISPELRRLWDANLDDFDVYELHLENCALRALHVAGIVPEHIETRNLVSPLQPGFSQGKLEMWVDIFPKEDGDNTIVPEAIDITPRVPEEFELRVVIWNCQDVILDEANIAGERMSDIYVKSFFRGMESKRERTDVHYRSLNGEGNFNWRHVHKFKYLPTEDNLVVKKKKTFLSWSAEEMRLPPILVLQVWDNDLFSKDDWLGEVELDLNDFDSPTLKAAEALLPAPRPAECEETGCKFENGACVRKKCKRKESINVFKAKRAKGWVPCSGFQRNDPEFEEVNGIRRKKLILSGRIEIEMELLSKAEAEAKPVGKGRKEPNAFPFLPKPNRPPTSFFWLTSPLKALRYIIWTNYWQYIIILAILAIAIAYLIIFLYHSPYFMNDKAFNSEGGATSSPSSSGMGTNSE